ncbi:MAG TPA: sigma-70 family RNA polymerase sigma factor [Anaerolineaceae bacterium]|nr:sigma-70 family RNA polymerase sigma factor [Anaerolineaceae bacterium]
MNARTRLLSLLRVESDPVDFDAVYRAEVTRVFNFFRYRVGDDQLAEDLTAETFEKAWRNRERYRRDRAAFSTWLFTIARRVAVDHYRRRQAVVSLEALSELPAGEPTENAIQERVDFARLTALLAQLAEHDRELVALRYGAGLTNRAIAGLTGLSESNVAVLLHRVVQKLRGEWEEQR